MKRESRRHVKSGLLRRNGWVVLALVSALGIGMLVTALPSGPVAAVPSCPTGATYIATSGSNAVCEQTFTSSGVWTAPAGVTSVDVVAVGGGGAGGGGYSAGACSPYYGGGNGGGGGRVVVETGVTAFGVSENVTVGGGGFAAATGPGGPGQSSSFGTLVTAAGGGGGDMFDILPPPLGTRTTAGGSGSTISGTTTTTTGGSDSDFMVDDPTFICWAGHGGGGGAGAGGNGQNGSATSDTSAAGGTGGVGAIPSAGLFAGVTQAYGAGGTGGSVSGSAGTGVLGASGGGANKNGTGGGGGGFGLAAPSGTPGLTGGSGVVIVRYLFAPLAAPTVSGVTPSSGSTSGGTSVSMTGTGFVSGATVTVGGVACTSVSVSSATALTCTTGVHAPGAVDIQVTNPDTQFGSLAGSFTYLATPTVATVSPSSGGTSGGTSITITGTYFASGATVTVGGAAATGVSVVSATTITATTPSGTAGGATVVVTNPDTRSGSKSNGFTYATPVTPPGAGSHGFAWGYGYYGSLGTGTTVDALAPVEVLDGTNSSGEWSVMGGGYYSTCGINPAGNAYCWGENSSGQLGDNTTTASLTPIAVLAGANTSGTWTAIGAGGGDEWACGIGSDTRAYCWGANGSDGYLGTGNGTASGTPVAVSNGANTGGTWRSISLGYYHTCGVGTDNKAYCWGYGSGGSLGNGSDSTRNTPVAVSSGANTSNTWSKVSGGYYSSCGINASGAAFCWGRGAEGQLGNGATSATNIPVAVLPGDNSSGTWKALAVGYYRACGIGGDDRAYCWGYMPTGYGATTSSTPKLVAIPGSDPVTALASDTADYASCAISGTAVYCWGENGSGQLGDGTTTDAATPVAVQLNPGFAGGTPLALSMGGDTSFLVIRYGTSPPSPPIEPSSGGGSGGSTPETAPTSAPATSGSAAAPVTLDPLDPIGQVQNPNIPAGGVPAGESVLLVNGQPAPVTVRPNEKKAPKSLIVDAAGLTMTLQGRSSNNEPLGLTSDQALILESNPDLRNRAQKAAKAKTAHPAAVSSGRGFMANSPVKFYILPGTYLGELTTDASGSYEGRVRVSAGMPDGVHTLQVNGYAPDRSVRSLSLGVLVKSGRMTLKTAKASSTVLFARSSAWLSPQGKVALQALTKQTGKNAITVASLGFVQESGSSANDQALSTVRAKAVGAYLRSLGLKGTYTVRGDGVGGPTANDRKVVVTVTYAKK